MSVIPQEVFEKYAMEYQSKIVDTTRQLATVRGQLQARERDKKLNELTAKELAGLDSNVAAYRSVGKMFIKEDLSALKQELQSKATNAAKEAQALERASGKLDNDLKDAEKSLSELIKKVKEQQQQQ